MNVGVRDAVDEHVCHLLEPAPPAARVAVAVAGAARRFVRCRRNYRNKVLGARSVRMERGDRGELHRAVGLRHRRVVEPHIELLPLELLLRAELLACGDQCGVLHAVWVWVAAVQPLVRAEEHWVGGGEGDGVVHRVQVLELTEIEEPLVAHKLLRLAQIGEADEAEGEAKLLHRVHSALAPLAPRTKRSSGGP